MRDDESPVLPVPEPVYREVAVYAQGPTHVRKGWFRRAVQLAFTRGYEAGVATERVRRMRYERGVQNSATPEVVAGGGYTWDSYDRRTGELTTHRGEGGPCLCGGLDLPHSPGLPGCRRVEAQREPFA